MKSLIIFISAMIVLPAICYSQDGALDFTFGAGGKVSTFGAGGKCGVLQLDDKIVLGGRREVGGIEYAEVIRYHPNGPVDSSFGTNGIASAPMATGSHSEINAAAMQSDGKILFAGKYDGVYPNYDDFLVMRYTSTGLLDSSFGTFGIATFSYASDDALYAIKEQSDGKILVAGGATDIVLLRCKGDGTLDSTFGTNGRVITDLNGTDIAYSIGIQTDGKIVVTGTGGMAIHDFVVARYNTNGTLDNTFGSGGKTLTHFGNVMTLNTAYAQYIQSDGKIVLAGSSDDHYFVLLRYNTNGTLDNSFGTAGITYTAFTAYTSTCFSICQQTDGKFVVAGTTRNQLTDYDFALARFNNNGILDSTFGTGGKVATDFIDQQGFSIANYGHAVFLQSNGKIVVAGSVATGFAAARYHASCVPTYSTFSFAACDSITLYNQTYTVSGNYVHTIPNLVGCDSIITLNLTVNSATPSNLNQSICQSESYFFNGVNLTAGGFYQDTLINSNGCDSIITLTLTIDSLPNVTLDGNPDFLCDNAAALALSGGNPIGGTYSGTGVSGNQFDPSIAGTGSHVITYSYTDGSGCVNSTNETIVVSICTGITGVNEDLKITVYPNPATNQLTINLGSLQVEQVSIYNVDGKLVSTTKQPANNRIDISNLANGVYIAEVKVRDAVQRVRWVKM